ncbi:hypothetical protein [Metabacillus sp. RGM 3146]|uniref:hypothetical protein n=1 Tax=Metabacillus sp. RGM 3146 TaxID=3401092 RepID=UPI003B99231D
MARFALITIIMPVLFLTSCSAYDFASPSNGRIKAKDKQIFFFSDEENIDKETKYYDALLDIKQKYPKEVRQMKVYQTEQKNPLQNHTFPSLVVIDNNQVIVKINGFVKSKEEIVRPITKALSN